jgi:S1-C subfamily serine protease
LVFSLPAGAKTFRTRIGLDRIAGDGGCTRARVFAGSTDGTPLYESPLLIGSHETIDTGPIALTGASEAPTRLILQVDVAHDNRPRGADPLDIRDTFDWLEPIVELDAQRLRAKLATYSERAISAWRDWAVAEERPAYRLVNYWDNVDPLPGCFRTAVVAEDTPLKLTRKVSVEEGSRWLVLGVTRPDNYTTQPATIEIRVNGDTLTREAVPIRDRSRPNPVPLVVSLSKYKGRPVTLDIVQSAGDSRSLVHWEAVHITDQIPTLLCLFEDDGKFQAVDPELESRASLVGEDRHMGDRAVKIIGPGRFELVRPDEVLRVRENPAWGDYRFLRFAFRKVGGGRICLELAHKGQQQEPARYDAGRGDSSYGDAQRIWQLELPDAWIVQTLDLYASFGNLDVTALVLGVPDGGHALFDHIHLARTQEDFGRLPPYPSPEDTNRIARTVLARYVRQQALPATVAIDRGNGHWGTGILVDGRAGLVLTAGHLVAGQRRQLDVYLADGRKVTGQRLGIDRANDVGVIRIAEKGPWPHVQIDFSNRDTYPNDVLYMAIAHDGAFQKGVEPAAYICAIHGIRDMDGLLGTDFPFDNRCRGGPLLDKDAKLIGVHSRINLSTNQCLYVPAENFAATWERVTRGEVFGAWPASIGPKIGVIVDSTPDGCRVKGVDPDSPAKAAGIEVNDCITRIDDVEVRELQDLNNRLAGRDPDDEVMVEISRGESRLKVRFRLMQHRVLHTALTP